MPSRASPWSTCWCWRTLSRPTIRTGPRISDGVTRYRDSHRFNAIWNAAAFVWTPPFQCNLERSSLCVDLRFSYHVMAPRISDGVTRACTSQTPHKRVGRACWPVLYISWYLTNVLDVLLSAAEEEPPGVLALRQLRPAHHAELAQRPLRLCPQSAPEEHATARAHQHAVVRRACSSAEGMQ